MSLKKKIPARKQVKNSNFSRCEWRARLIGAFGAWVERNGEKRGVLPVSPEVALAR